LSSFICYSFKHIGNQGSLERTSQKIFSFCFEPEVVCWICFYSVIHCCIGLDIFGLFVDVF